MGHHIFVCISQERKFQHRMSWSFMMLISCGKRLMFSLLIIVEVLIISIKISFHNKNDSIKRFDLTFCELIWNFEMDT